MGASRIYRSGILVIVIVIEMSRRMFDHEELEVYRASVGLHCLLEPILQRLPKSLSVTDQLDRASTQQVIVLANIRERFLVGDAIVGIP